VIVKINRSMALVYLLLVIRVSRIFNIQCISIIYIEKLQ